MSDDWGDLEAISKPKSQVPKLLFCGCGCLLPVLLVILVLFWGFGVASRGTDTEYQLQELDDVLPFDEPPEGFVLRFGYQPGLFAFLFDPEVYLFMEEMGWEEPDADPGADTDDLSPVEFEEETAEEIGEELASEPQGSEPQKRRKPPRIWILMRSGDEDLQEMTDTSRDDVSPWSPPGSEAIVTLRVQGRDLPVAMIRGSKVQLPWGAPTEGSGTDDAALAIRIDFDPDGQTLILLIVGEDIADVTPEKIIGFLESFHVGPER